MSNLDEAPRTHLKNTFWLKNVQFRLQKPQISSKYPDIPPRFSVFSLLDARRSCKTGRPVFEIDQFLPQKLFLRWVLKIEARQKIKF